MEKNKAAEILEVTRRLIMERGYNGFSFRDIAAQVGIKSSSIHYHFPTKSELGVAAAKDYRDWCSRALEDLSARDAPGLLAAYGDLFVAMLKDQGSVCLGGVLVSDAATLPPQVKAEVERFFQGHHEWVCSVLIKGQTEGDIRPEIDPKVFAATFVSSIEGAMMVARGTGRADHLSDAIDQLIQLVRTQWQRTFDE